MNSARASLKPADVNVGDAVTTMDIDLNTTLIVAGAIATRDFMPVHHDRDYAQGQGAPDLFMNILSTNAYCARFVTDWAGPETFVKNISIRLGVPAIPNKNLVFTGEVLSKTDNGDESDIEVSLKATNELGDHATGTVLISLPN